MRNADSMKTLRVLRPARRAALCLSLLLGALSLAMTACKKEEAESKPIVAVQTAVVLKTDLVQVVASEATLYPINQSAITPQVSAPVKQFYVNRGSRVKQGQLLAVLENSDLSAAAIENRGGLEQAQAAYSSATRASLPEEWKKAELDASTAKQILEAEQKLYSSRENLFQQGALPRKELDQAALTLTQSRNQNEVAQQHLATLQSVGKDNQLKSAKGQLASARGKFMGATALLHYSEIHSPISGIVADRPLFAGETAPAGVPLLVIVDSSKIIAKAHLAQEQAALVKVGDTAEITVPGEEKVIEAKVTVVSPTVDANSTTIEIWVQADNPEGNLHPGTNAHLSIAVAKIPGAMVVPSESVLTSGEGRTTVMVVGKDNIARQAEVKVGIRQGSSTQIVAGIHPGDTVVASGAYGLPDGTQVQLAAPAVSAKFDRAEKAE
jgi:multidrug efflux pump subunit AcrA (membrane-fusion protein)